MATITTHPLFRHLQSSSTSYVHRVRNGRSINAGIGLSFWFRPGRSAISELPVDEQELPLLFRDRTADHQEVAVQSSITYRFADPEQAAQRIDFSIDDRAGTWTATPLEQVGGLLIELAQQHAAATIRARPLTEVIAAGPTPLRSAISDGLRADQRLARTGIEVVGNREVGHRFGSVRIFGHGYRNLPRHIILRKINAWKITFNCNDLSW